MDQNLRSGRRVIVMGCDGSIDAIKGRVLLYTLHVDNAVWTHAGRRRGRDLDGGKRGGVVRQVGMGIWSSVERGKEWGRNVGSANAASGS